MNFKQHRGIDELRLNPKLKHRFNSWSTNVWYLILSFWMPLMYKISEVVVFLLNFVRLHMNNYSSNMNKSCLSHSGLVHVVVWFVNEWYLLKDCIWKIGHSWDVLSLVKHNYSCKLLSYPKNKASYLNLRRVELIYVLALHFWMKQYACDGGKKNYLIGLLLMARCIVYWVLMMVLRESSSVQLSFFSWMWAASICNYA